jgi:hypothetical protein
MMPDGRRQSKSKRCLIVLALLQFSSSEASEFAALGIVEESLMVGTRHEVLEASLRLGFVSTPTGWRAICRSKPHDNRNETCELSDPERSRKWSVWFKGSEIGEVSTSGWVSSEHYYKSGQLQIASSQIPHVAERTNDFSGWDGVKKYRPLVAVTGLRPRAASAWSESTPSKGDVDAVWPTFRQIVPRIPSCRYDDKGRSLDHPTTISKQHLEVFRVIRLNHGEKLIGARVARRYTEPCNEMSGVGSDVWFVSTAHSNPRIISRRPNMDDWSWSQEFIDVGDFAGDGNVEALFWYSGYNEDGYILYFDQFAKSARFTWSYH